MSHKIIRLTPEKFAAAVADTEMTPGSIYIARRILVDGKKSTDMIKETGLCKQRINAIVHRVMQCVDDDSITLALGHRIVGLLVSSKVPRAQT